MYVNELERFHSFIPSVLTEARVYKNASAFPHPPSHYRLSDCAQLAGSFTRAALFKMSCSPCYLKHLSPVFFSTARKTKDTVADHRVVFERIRFPRITRVYTLLNLFAPLSAAAAEQYLSTREPCKIMRHVAVYIIYII